jgi:hypothetical protein
MTINSVITNGNPTIVLTTAAPSATLGGVTFTQSTISTDVLQLATSVAATGVVNSNVFTGTSSSVWAQLWAVITAITGVRGSLWVAATSGNCGAISSTLSCITSGHLVANGNKYRISGGSCVGAVNLIIEKVL